MLLRQASVIDRRRRRVPTCWLMTDARLGDAMPRIAATMPPRSGIVIRPYAMDGVGQAALIRALRRISRAKRHLLLLSDAKVAQGFDGCHAGGGRYRGRRPDGFQGMAVHDRLEAASALRLRADAVFISPVFPTRSHNDAPTLGLDGFAPLAARFPGKAIALGGVNHRRFFTLKRHHATGWAAIDAWLV